MTLSLRNPMSRRLLGAASFVEIEGGVQIGQEPVDNDEVLFRLCLNATASATELEFFREGEIVFASPGILGNL